ncbi:uncharacterized protein LOC122509998 [Leptopilina heterotoma]|nr:uncharacterized protein LOC122509998 [Leptopilina heterotoma]
MLEEDPQCMRLNVISQTSSHTCVVCNAPNNVHRLSLNSRVNIFVKRNIYIPVNNVCCNEHLDESGFLQADIVDQLRFINRPYIIRGRELQSLLEALRGEVFNVAQGKFNDEHGLTDQECNVLTSLSKEQFLDLFAYCENAIEVPGGHRYVSKKDLLCFLTKLRQGLSDELLRVMFNYSSRQATSLAIATVRKTLMQQFVVENIGFAAISRDEFIERHTTDFSNKLYNPDPENPKAIIYNDCTYLDIEKSSCFKALRQSFCVHKSKHLVKPSVLVASDGYILDIQGPYFSNAKNNDAKILIKEFQRDINGMRRWIQPEDIFVVDRGYRDAIPFLDRVGIVPKMPPLLDRNQRQFTTEQANESRLITKTRWIVEAINGHLKIMFKFFSGTISTSHVPNLSDFLRIAGAIINKYRGPITMEGANEEMAQEMLNRSTMPNVVQARVELENLQNRRARWVLLTAAHVPLFPQLTVNYLKDLTTGTYQLHLAPSYVQDTILRAEEEDENDDIEQAIEIDNTQIEEGFIRLRIYSRFTNAKRHQIWIVFNTEYNPENDQDQDNNPILGYYCICKVGARTLGACAHITSILWFLGYARHEDNVRYPSTRLLRTVQNAAMDVDNHEIIDPYI